MTYKAVLFDLFGTLVSSSPWRRHDDIVAAMADLLAIPYEQFYQVFNQETRMDRELGVYASMEENILDVANKLGVQVDSSSAAQAARVRYDFTASVMDPRPDALSTLNQLQAGAMPLGLISDCSPEVPKIWPGTELARYFEVALFSSDLGIKKPNPKIYLMACQALQVEAQQCLYVGDGGSHELSGAADLGMDALLLDVPGEEFGEEFRPDAQDWDGPTVESLAQVVPIALGDPLG